MFHYLGGDELTVEFPDMKDANGKADVLGVFW